jgi:ribosomal protein S6--L-glutamate ligase
MGRRRRHQLKIGILSRGASVYSTRRLLEAARDRGHKPRVLDTLKFSIALERQNPDLFYAGKPLAHHDAVIPRIGASVTFFGTAVVRQLEQMGVFCVNSATGIANSRDKLRSLQILSRHDIGIPGTAFARDRSDILPAIERLGGAPVVIKVLEGTQGIGVILADTTKVAESIIETLQSASQNVLIQKFIAESKGRDVRAFVVGDRVVAAMRRVAQGQEFRSNIHRGGLAEPLTLEPEYETTAVRAAQIMGLKVAGVDMLEGRDGPQVMEVNSSPGLEGIENTTGVDVAGAVVEYIEQHFKFPELDVREWLSESPGYGVAELTVSPTSQLAGKRLADTKLRDLDIMVLSIRRGHELIANPKGTRRLEADDRLLCFGRLAGMRKLIPRPKPRRKPEDSPEGEE